tara:strand:- start:17198 stop:17419 length:222 start_codon:yes stop_codon:yes gene_type:complete
VKIHDNKIKIIDVIIVSDVFIPDFILKRYSILIISINELIILLSIIFLNVIINIYLNEFYNFLIVLYNVKKVF